MKAIKGKGLRLIDAMIMVAGLALGCSLIEPYGIRLMIDPGSPSDSVLDRLYGLIVVCVPLLLASTMAATIVRLLRPRPSFRYLARQPGFTACLPVTILGAILLSTGLAREYGAGRWHAGQPLPLYITYYLVWPMSCLVIGAWSVQWGNRRWRPEPSAIDRVGRILGLGWVILLLFDRINIIYITLSIEWRK
jgi:hypothetical protein